MILGSSPGLMTLGEEHATFLKWKMPPVHFASQQILIECPLHIRTKSGTETLQGNSGYQD